VDEEALCLSSSECDHHASQNPGESYCHEDKHKALSSNYRNRLKHLFPQPNIAFYANTHSRPLFINPLRNQSPS
jgi:hypothetical protein